MIAFPSTLKQLQDTIDSYIEFGEDTPVGTQVIIPMLFGGIIGLNDSLQREVVYIDAEGKIVGDEAND